MKKDLHPTWYPEAVVLCQCGNSWNTGATVPEIRTEICSACHPFFTGEQRIVDTEGRVDAFMSRLARRDKLLAEQETTNEEEIRTDLPLKELKLEKRYLTILQENGIQTAQDVLDQLTAGGDDALLGLDGIGIQVVSDLKKRLRQRGYEIPAGKTEAEATEE